MKREVKQGFHLAPYLFILMGEVFNFMVKDAMRVGKIQKISLQEIQTIFQYLNDIAIFIKWEKMDMKNVVKLLDNFLLNAMEINWSKSMAYWKK